MNFAVYQPWIYLYGGIERSLLELLQRSRHHWKVYTGHYSPATTFPGFSRFSVTELQHLSVQRSMSSVLVSSLKLLRERVPVDDVDALAIWCDGVGDLLTFGNNALPLFNICSTPLRPAFDPVYARQAMNKLGPAKRLAFRTLRSAFRLCDRWAWSRYDGVIATSQEVKQRILDGRLYKDGPAMKLLHPGIDWRAIAPGRSFEPMLLVPGRIMWTKNIALALEAFLRAGLPKPWRLVIAGFVDEKSRPLYDSLRARVPHGVDVEFVVAPSDEKLHDLYDRASAVLFPPLNEDWGIVPLEAMAHGKPVMAVDAGGPRESVLHGRTGWLLPPDPDIWADRLREAAANPDELRRMGLQAREHSARYDWSTFVDGIDDAFEEWTLAHPKHRARRKA